MGTNRNTIEKFSLGHQLFRYYVDFFFKIFFRTKSHNYNKVPQDEIIIFALNHQNTLIDALALLATVKKQPVFMARADIFNKKTINNILTFLKILPIYRIRDGKESLRNNDDIFLKTVDVLKNKNGLVILPEGSHLGIRRLRTLKKGISRIALQAEESNDYKLNIKIIPVGLDYSNYINFRSKLFVNFGEAINVSDYYEAYKENPPRGMNLLRERVEEELKKYMIHIGSDEYYKMIDFLRRFYLHELNINTRKQPDTLFAEQKIIEKLNRFIEQKPDEANQLKGKVENFEALLQKLNFKLWVLQKSKYPIFGILLQSIFMVLLFPLYLFGTLINYIPYKIPVILTRKVKDRQFLSSFRFVIAILLFPIYYLILAIIGSLIIENTWVILISILSSLIMGLFAFHYYIEIKKLWAKIRYNYLSRSKNKTLEKIKLLYNEIFEFGKKIL